VSNNYKNTPSIISVARHYQEERDRERVPQFGGIYFIALSGIFWTMMCPIICRHCSRRRQVSNNYKNTPAIISVARHYQEERERESTEYLGGYIV
jgi:hypothetical protein